VIFHWHNLFSDLVVFPDESSYVFPPLTCSCWRGSLWCSASMSKQREWRCCGNQEGKEILSWKSQANSRLGTMTLTNHFYLMQFKESEDDEVVRKTTLREVKLLRLMRHPNIVCLKEAFRRKSKLYLVFEFVERNLLEVLEENPNGLDYELARSFAFQLVQAIYWCHRSNIVHRDIKPENLLVSRKNELKLCDFGFARVVSGNQPLTDYVATRWYRAPELLLGSTRYTAAVDMWAIGCIMGELIDGQPLFPGESEIDQLYIIQKILGPLAGEHMQQFLKNKRFAGLKFPDMSHPETLQKRYMGTLSKRGIAFMTQCMLMKPQDRLSSRDAVVHPLFEDLIKEYAVTHPNISNQLEVDKESHDQARQHSRQGMVSGSATSASSAYGARHVRRNKASRHAPKGGGVIAEHENESGDRKKLPAAPAGFGSLRGGGGRSGRQQLQQSQQRGHHEGGRSSNKHTAPPGIVSNTSRLRGSTELSKPRPAHREAQAGTVASGDNGSSNVSRRKGKATGTVGSQHETSSKQRGLKMNMPVRRARDYLLGDEEEDDVSRNGPPSGRRHGSKHLQHAPPPVAASGGGKWTPRNSKVTQLQLQLQLQPAAAKSPKTCLALERERQRERQRESEIRAFREFSTQLPSRFDPHTPRRMELEAIKPRTPALFEDAGDGPKWMDLPSGRRAVFEPASHGKSSWPKGGDRSTLPHLSPYE
jgi:cyclin-dependent kinase-like